HQSHYPNEEKPEMLHGPASSCDCPELYLFHRCVLIDERVEPATRKEKYWYYSVDEKWRMHSYSEDLPGQDRSEPVHLEPGVLYRQLLYEKAKRYNNL